MQGFDFLLRIHVPCSSESMIEFLKLSCTGLSLEDTNLVPIWIPSAPAAKAAAMPIPSTIPPAATIGKSVCFLIA